MENATNGETSNLEANPSNQAINILTPLATSDAEQPDTNVCANDVANATEDHVSNLETDPVDDYRFADYDFDGYEAPWNNDFSKYKVDSVNSDFTSNISESNENTMPIDKNPVLDPNSKDVGVSSSENQQAGFTDGNLPSEQQSVNSDEDSHEISSTEYPSGNAAEAFEVSPTQQSIKAYFMHSFIFVAQYTIPVVFVDFLIRLTMTKQIACNILVIFICSGTQRIRHKRRRVLDDDEFVPNLRFDSIRINHGSSRKKIKKTSKPILYLF